MKEEKETRRRETRRERERLLMESVYPETQLEKRMQVNEVKKEKELLEVKRQEETSNRYENSIGRCKVIPDYQRQWEKFDKQMEKKKDIFRQEHEKKFSHIKPIVFEQSKLVVPIKDELEEINNQIRMNQERRQRTGRVEEMSVPQVRMTKKSAALVERKKQERQKKSDEVDKSMRD